MQCGLLFALKSTMNISKTQIGSTCVYSIVPVIENGGGTAQYPSSAIAGQLYTYRLSPSMSVLLTRGLPEDAGVAVGISEDAAGVYQCVARNVLETDTETVNVEVVNGLFPS